MEYVIKIGQLLLSLSILIVLHELGHFLFARLFKTRVEKFYLFFNPWFSLFKVKKGDTEYGIGWLPLGGYVKISGMIDESMDKEQMKQPPQPHEFRSKPSYQRLLIMLGGVLVNLILAFLIYSAVLFTWGDRYLPNENVKDGIWVTDSLMHQANLETGDKIISIGGERVERFGDILGKMIVSEDMVIERNGQVQTVSIPVNLAGMISDHRIHHKGPLFTVRMPFIIGAVVDTLHNADAGMQAKDLVVSVNGKPIKYYDEYVQIADTMRNREAELIVSRDNKQHTLNVYFNENGKLGVHSAFASFDDLERLGYYKLERNQYTFAQSIPAGFILAKTTLTDYVKSLGLLFDRDSGAAKSIGGFGAIMNLFPPSWDWYSFWTLTAFLSIMLAFLNVLPIPALDGGHVAFLLYEMVTGRKPGEKFLEYAQMIGMLLLLALLLYANGNDVWRGIQRLMGS